MISRRQFLAALFAAPVAALASLGLRKKAIQPQEPRAGDTFTTAVKYVENPPTGICIRIVRRYDGEHVFYRYDVLTMMPICKVWCRPSSCKCRQTQ